MKRWLVVVAACTHPGRTTPPTVPEPARFVPPPITERTLRSGVRVLVVENHRLPIVSIATIHAAGGSREDGDHPGLAALTVDSLGAAPELADALDREGARLELDIATDYASTHLAVLSDHLDAAVAVLGDVIRRPRLTDADVVRVRTERVTELAQHRDRSRTVAAQLFDRIVFGAHPYAHAAEGTALAVARLEPEEVRAFWARAYTPSTTTVIVAGDVTADAAVRLLDHGFGDWSHPSAAETVPPPRATASAQLAYVDVPGAEQSIVMIGRRAPPDADRAAADVANLVLGGTQTARLDRRLRDELGVTFGAGSSFWRGAWAQTWVASTAFRTAATADGIRATLAVIAAATAAEPATDELARGKALLARGVAQSFETTVGTVRALQRLVTQGLPTSELAAYPDRVARVTPAAARAALAPLAADLVIVVVGDWAAIGDGLRALGLPIVRHDGEP